MNHEQLAWASGYLAGLGALEPTSARAANESPAMTILYATQGGNARSVAEALADSATARGYAPRLIAADQYRPRDLAKERLLVAVISTQGEGEPPESAHELFKFLKSRKTPRLDGLHYAVFGLGDSSYEFFNRAAKELDVLLQATGAEALLARIDADVDFQPLSAQWQTQLLREVEKVQPEQSRVIPLQPAPSASRNDRNHPYQAELLERRRITTADAVAEVHHLALEIDAEAIRYRPQLHPSVAKAWAGVAGDAKLSALSEDAGRLRRFAGERQFIDLLQAYPAQVDADRLVALLHSQQPRLYSIASSQAAYEDEIHLTVSTLRYQAHARDHLGGASGFLTRRIAEGDKLGVYVAENPGFRLPQTNDTPIIMVGAGTGVAPYRAFLQEREAAGASGANWLVFGNRHFHRDFLYQSDWLNYRKQGLLNRISLAFSRDEGDRTYVQARLYEEGAELYRWLQEGAHLYVCGGIAMERAVRQSLQGIAQAQGGLDEEAADEYIESLREQGRYQRDVY
ncbi:MAG: flavodoxin domain-containing protein [Candidatus Thiodiazotropha sp.]